MDRHSEHGTIAVNTSGVELYHLAYPSGGGNAQYRKVTELPYCLLSPGAILRVHSGERRDISVLNSDDRAGADWHYFTGRDVYVWNNREGDAPALYVPSTRGTIDSCSYDPWPPEGETLQRQGNKLAAMPVAAGTYRR